MKVFFALYRYLFYFPLFAVTFTTFGLLTVLVSCVIPANKARAILRVYSRFVLFTIGIRLKVEGKENIEKGRSYVIVSNHRSNLDPVVIWAGLQLDLLWIMKVELMRIPVFGFVMKQIGNIGIDRSNSQKAIKSISVAKQRLVDGTSMVFFPEGTRYTGDGISAFKKGAFHFALEMDLPILPVTISASEKLMPPHSVAIQHGKAKIVIHKPIETKGSTIQSLNEVMEKTKKSVEEGFDFNFR